MDNNSHDKNKNMENTSDNISSATKRGKKCIWDDKLLHHSDIKRKDEDEGLWNECNLCTTRKIIVLFLDGIRYFAWKD